MTNKSDFKNRPDEYWRKKLTPEQYNITRQKATEEPFTGKFWDNHATGMYECVSCGASLFSSSTKFESGSGWPSFDRPENLENIELHEDVSFGMKRTEVICKQCGAHLGHLFPDGPTETGERYCINSCSLQFSPQDK